MKTKILIGFLTRFNAQDYELPLVSKTFIED